MRKDVEAQQSRGERVILFAQSNPTYFAAGDAASDLSVVTNEVAKLSNLVSDQQSGDDLSTGATSSKTALLDRLTSEQRALRRTFNQLKKKDPAITGDINLPGDYKEGTLIGAVRAAIGVVTPLKARFIARGKKADFLDAINADLAAYDALVSQQQSGTGERQMAVDEIERSVEALIDAIEDLDDIMENALDEPSEAALLSEWKRASKLGAIRRNPGNATPVTPPAG